MEIDKTLPEKERQAIFFDKINKGEYDISRFQYENEIIIENDNLPNNPIKKGEWVNSVCKKLKNKGYSYSVYDHNGKCPHIHIYNIKGLEKLSKKDRIDYKKKFIFKYGGSDSDLSFSSAFYVPNENKLHWKKFLGIKGCEDYGVKKLEMEHDSKKENELEDLSEVKVKSTSKNNSMQNNILNPIRSLKDIFDKGIPPINWRIKNLVTESGIVILGGTSGSYKTWVAMHIALCCVTGKPLFNEFEVKKCNVLYFDEENGDITLPNRFDMLRRGHNLSDEEFGNLFISIFNNLKLDNKTMYVRLIEDIEKYNPKVVIIDSMVRCMEGEEDRAKDVRVVYENIKQILNKYRDICFIILHHTTKQGSGISSLRGSGDFTAFSDVVLMFNKTEEGRVFIKFGKNRHIDTSKFKGFCIEVTNPSKDDINLNYIGDTTEGKDKSERCLEDIQEWISNNDSKEFKSTDLKSDMEKQGHSPWIYYEVLGRLKQNKKIKEIKKGVYKIV